MPGPNAGMLMLERSVPKSEIVALMRTLQRSSQKNREQRSSNRFSERSSIELIEILRALIIYIEERRIVGLLAVRLYDFEIVRPLDMPN